MSQPRTTPLYNAHKAAGGRFVTFAGWKMPVHYGSILAEARAVREAAGMFDVSHMGRALVRGPGSLDLLQHLGTNDLSKVKPGKAQYTLWCDADGGAIDDLIVCWMDETDFVLIVNASRRDDDLAHLRAAAEGRDVQILDESDSTAMIAVQGPQAIGIVESLGADVSGLPRFGVTRTTAAGVGVSASRTGYTGEDGVELVCDAGAAARLWEALRAAGVVPCGLGARDALRMEMGFPLYGHELSPGITPLEARVAFAVALGKPDFIGRDALVKIADEHPRRLLVGFVCARPCVPAQGDPVAGTGIEGEVTSGGTSVVLDAPIGLAMITPPDASLPAGATIVNRGKSVDVELRPLPLIDRSRPKK